MKKWLILIGVITIFLVGGYFYLSYYAVKFVQARLQQVTGPGFAITEINVRPTYLAAKGIRYEDSRLKKETVFIEEMRIYPSFFSLLRRTLSIREWRIIRPSFYFHRTQGGNFVGPWIVLGKEKEKGESFVSKKEEGKEPVRVKIDRLRILKGGVDFEDQKVGEPSGVLRLRNLDLDLGNIQYPMTSARSPIELRGAIQGGAKEGEIRIKGWIDLETMDMEASSQVHEMEVRLFEPYYRKRVSAEIESGYFNMESKIAVAKRKIDAPGHLELVDLRIKEGGGTVLWFPAETLVSLLREKGNRIKVAFRVKGDMDNPRFNLQEVLLTRIAISLAQALGMPIKVVGETMVEGTGKGAEGLAGGLKSIEKLFKKKKEEKR